MLFIWLNLTRQPLSNSPLSIFGVALVTCQGPIHPRTGLKARESLSFQPFEVENVLAVHGVS
jgi:hypothetical protein